MGALPDRAIPNRTNRERIIFKIGVDATHVLPYIQIIETETDKMIKQCANLECVKPFSFRVEGQRGRRINVKAGDIFWNKSAEYMQKSGIIKLARKGKNMAFAYAFTLENVSEYFKVMD